MKPGVGAATDPVVWHDLECGAYRADLPLWLELAERETRAAPLLEIGAGSGRVTLELARAGHAVIALDSDARLLATLRARGAGLAIETVVADARDFELARRDLALCIVPMQTLQLMGGPQGRRALLSAVRGHMRAGGLLACAIATRLETFDADDGPLPTPDTVRIGAALYVSRPLAIRRAGARVRLEREREKIAAEPGPRVREHNVIVLDRLSARRLEREAGAAGFRAERARRISPTDDHVGSTVVMLRA